MTYDKREALKLAAQWLSARRPLAQKSERQRAADELLVAVLSVFDEAGYAYEERGNARSVGPGDASDGLHVLLKANDSTGVWIRPGRHSTLGEARDPAIVYDPIAKEWVGVEPDRFVAQVQGEPVPMRSAVAVVVATILAALDELSAQK